MGLDMYLFSAKKLRAVKGDPGAVKVDGRSKAPVEIAYWRKHPDLHGLMEDIYQGKDGTAEDFNCVGVELTKDDIDYIISVIDLGELPDTQGFFFGDSDGLEKEHDLDVFKRALEIVKSGEHVYYDSWW